MLPCELGRANAQAGFPGTTSMFGIRIGSFAGLWQALQ